MMTLSRYFKIGLILSASLAASSLAVTYTWLGGTLWRSLDPVFQVFLILTILWMVVFPFIPSISPRQRGEWFIVLLAAFVLPVLILQRDYYVLIVPSALLLKSFGQNPWYLVLMEYCLMILILFAVWTVRRADSSLGWNRNLRFALCFFLSLFLLPVLVNAGAADSFQRTAYRGLISLRGEYKPKETKVVVAKIASEGITRQRYMQLVSMFAAGHPTAIGMLSQTGPIVHPDSVAKMTDVPLVAEFGGDPSEIKSAGAQLSADRQARPIMNSFGVPMYYTPYNRRGIDFSVKLAQRYFHSQGLPDSIARSSSAVTVGQSTIPLVAGDRALINHYWMHPQSADKFYRESTLPVFRPFVYFEFEQYAGNMEASLYGDQYYNVNYAKNRLEARTGKEIEEHDGSVTWRTRALEPATIDLRGKILIVEVAGWASHALPLPGYQLDGMVAASIVQNILDGQFLGASHPMFDFWFSALLIAAVWWTYKRWGSFKACGTVLLGSIILFAVAAIVFSGFDWFLNPVPVGAALAVSIAVFFPVGVVSERQNLIREKMRLNAELDAARSMQMGLMPKEDPEVKGYDISGICLPANEVGGDFFDYVWLDPRKEKLGIAVADVSGKSMNAAITAVMTSGMIYQEIENGQSPKKILRKINKPLFMKIDDRMFTALSFGVLDTRKKELRFSNAGQMYPVLNRKGNVIMLEVKGARLPLGIKKDVAYEEMVVKLKRGDTIIFYTDGIPEAKNEKDEFYGFERFKNLAGNLRGGSAKQIRDQILDDVKSFTGKSPQYDDMTVVVANVL